jgi:hypothetical protein
MGRRYKIQDIWITRFSERTGRIESQTRKRSKLLSKPIFDFDLAKGKDAAELRRPSGRRPFAPLHGESTTRPAVRKDGASRINTTCRLSDCVETY